MYRLARPEVVKHCDDYRAIHEEEQLTEKADWVISEFGDEPVVRPSTIACIKQANRCQQEQALVCCGIASQEKPGAGQTGEPQHVNDCKEEEAGFECPGLQVDALRNEIGDQAHYDDDGHQQSAKQAESSVNVYSA